MSLESWFPKTPHPITGEPFLTSENVEVEQNHELVTWFAGPPDEPSATYVDEDDFVVERTPEELAAARAKYEDALARWVEAGWPNGSQSAMIQTGPALMSGRFHTASGAIADGVREMPNGDWIWTSWSAPTGACESVG